MSTSTSNAVAPTISVDLKLDSDEDFPRCLLKLPTGQLLAYGGDDGTISLVTFNDTKNKSIATPVRRFDEEAVRALAVSSDGKRVAVGFDSGATQIYAYPDFDVTSSSSSSLHHPFLPVSAVTDTNKEEADDEDNLFPQSDGLGGSLTVPGEKYFAGPCFDSPVRDLVFLPLKQGNTENNTEQQYWLAAAWESGMCVLNATASATVTVRHLEEFAKEAYDEGGIRGLACSRDPHPHALASLGMDGRLCLWDLSDTDHPENWKLLRRENSCCVTKRDVGEVFGADAWDRSCRPHFVQSSDNMLLAMPGATYLQLRNLAKTTPMTVTDYDQPVVGDDKDSPHQGHIESIVTMTSSPISDDPFIITSGRDGRVVLWEIQSDKADETLTATFVRQLGQFESKPTFLLWDKDASGEERLCIACAIGTLMTIQGREHIAPKFVKNTKKVSSSGAKEQAKGSSSQPGRLSQKKQTETIADSDDDNDNMFDEDEDVADQDIVEDKPRNRFVEDEADDDESITDVDAVTSPTAAAVQLQAANDYDSEQEEDEFDFDIPAANTAGPAIQYKTIDLPKPQPAFAPSSTPLDLTRRYMCWNHIGSVTLLQGELGMSRSNVDIHFTDSAFRRPISFTDNMGFILGSLGEDGGIFATDVSDDDDLGDVDDDDFGDVVNNMSEATKAAVKRSQRNRMSKEGGLKATGSSIYFHRFETFGALRDKDWYLTLPAGERALGCACGEGWGAVITSRRFLRLFSSGGNQGQVLWLGGEPVTMVGRSRFLAVFYHEGTPLADGTQKLGYLLFDATTNQTITKGSVCGISKGSSLLWAGFNNDGTLLTMDSDGMVSMLVCSSSIYNNESTPSSWEWMPMLDTVGLHKSAEDSYWPISMYDAKLICVPLKGGVKHPDAARRPVTASLGLRMPLARGALTKSNALEELSVRAGIALVQKKVMHGIMSEGDVDDEFDREYTALSAQVDKVTLKMFAATIEAGKLERALDLVERLHLEKSFDLAMTIANNHRKLVDLIEDVRNNKFTPLEPDYTEQDYDDDYDEQDAPTQRITPDSNKAKRALEDGPLDDLGPTREVRRKSAFA